MSYNAAAITTTAVNIKQLSVTQHKPSVEKQSPATILPAASLTTSEILQTHVSR